MSRAEALFYDGSMSAPRPAEVSWASPEVLEVEVGKELRRWNVREKHFTWELTAESLRITHGIPPEVLVIRDPQVLGTWRSHFKLLKKGERRVASWPWLLRVPLMLPLGFIAVLLAVYFWVLPWAAERAVPLLPTSVDTRVGDAMFNGMGTTLTIDTARSAALQRFGDRLKLAPTFNLHYHVVDDAQVNAFAMPGGHIVVYTGLLDRMTEPAELAALLAHEGTHVEKRHSTRSLARQLSGNMFLAVVLGDASGLVGAAAAQADQLRGLGYSRDLETEADTIGIRLLHNNGVDPNGMLQLLELLQAEAQDMPEAAEFLSSHPLTKERIATAQQVIASVGDVKTEDPGLQPLFEALRK